MNDIDLQIEQIESARQELKKHFGEHYELSALTHTIPLLEELKAIKDEKEYWDMQNNKAYEQGRADELKELRELKETYAKGMETSYSEFRYKQGIAEGYSKAENDYFAQSQKDREDTYNCGYAIGRADAIDEFKQALKQELNKYDFWIYNIADSDGYTLETSCNRDYLIDEIADRMKGE